MPASKDPTEINNFFGFLKKGYTLRELFFRGVPLKLYSLISHFTIPFRRRGDGLQISFYARVDGAKFISVGDQVWLQRHCWLSVPLLYLNGVEKKAYLEIDDGCRIGPFCTISAIKKVTLKKNVLLGPNVTIMDHIHDYKNPHLPIHSQPLQSEGSVTIEENCWLAANVVVSGMREIVIGKNSVIAANSVVTQSIPPYSVAAGAPAKIIKQYNFESQEWVSV